MRIELDRSAEVGERKVKLAHPTVEGAAPAVVSGIPWVAGDGGIPTVKSVVVSCHAGASSQLRAFPTSGPMGPAVVWAGHIMFLPNTREVIQEYHRGRQGEQEGSKICASM